MQAAVKGNNPKPEGFCWRVPKAKPKNCWCVLCPGSSSEFLFNSPIHGSKGGKTFAGTSCAQAPFQNSFSRLLSKGAKKLLARPVPWRLYKIPFSSSFPKGQENCWRVLCPGSFSGFLFKAPVKLLARPFIPFQKLGKFAGASLPVLSMQKQTQYNTWAPARSSHGPRQDITNKTLGTKP